MSEILIYQADNQPVEVRLEGETVWLRQEQMAELFGRDRTVIGRHIRNVFAEGELAREAVCAKFAHTAADGKNYQVEQFNLDVIISVGYRVKSTEGVRFRQWATRVLREHLTRGFTLNRQRFETNARELEAALLMVRRLAGNAANTVIPAQAVIPAKAGIQSTQPRSLYWIPTPRLRGGRPCTGMTSPFHHCAERSGA